MLIQMSRSFARTARPDMITKFLILMSAASFWSEAKWRACAKAAARLQSPMRRSKMVRSGLSTAIFRSTLRPIGSIMNRNVQGNFCSTVRRSGGVKCERQQKDLRSFRWKFIFGSIMPKCCWVFVRENMSMINGRHWKKRIRTAGSNSICCVTSSADGSTDGRLPCSIWNHAVSWHFFLA